MALIKCPECGREISDKATACPHCGMPMTPAQTDIRPAAEPQPAQPDKTAELENLRTLAERAKSANDTANAARYYDQILMLDPNDWSANFYQTYFSVQNVKIYQLGEAANRMANRLDSVLTLLKKQVPAELGQRTACLEIVLRLGLLKKMLVDNAIAHIGSTLDAIRENTDKWIVPALELLITAADRLQAHFNSVEFWEIADSAYMLADSDAKQLKGVMSTPGISRVAATASARRSTLAAKIKQAKADKAAKERQARIDAYWAEHADEKRALEEEIAGYERQAAELDQALQSYRDGKEEIQKRRNSKTPLTEEIARVDEEIRAARVELAPLGLFQMRRKKELNDRIEDLSAKRLKLSEQQMSLIKENRAVCDKEAAELERRWGPQLNEIARLKKEIKRVRDELDRDR